MRVAGAGRRREEAQWKIWPTKRDSPPLMTEITRRLPFGLSAVVAPSLVGYLLINLCTFFIDLGLLGLFHGTFGWPIPAAVTLSYGTASALSYALNRVLNFRSHSYVGRQFLVFAAVSGSNYLIFVLGLTDLLSSRWRVLRALPGHRGALRGRLPVLHDALGGVPRRAGAAGRAAAQAPLPTEGAPARGGRHRPGPTATEPPAPPRPGLPPRSAPPFGPAPA